MKRALTLILTVPALGVLLIAGGCGAQSSGRASGAASGTASSAAAAARAPVAVEALTVTRGSLVRDVQAAGIVTGINEATVVSETQGIIQEVSFDIGDRLAAGQVLLKVDDTIARLSMEQARQQLENARTDLAAAEQLAAGGAASKAELARARSAVSGAEARYQSALKSFQDATVRSPLGGYVASREAVVAMGNYLSPGQRLARVVDISSLKVEVAVGEGQIGLIEVGAPATVVVPAAPSDGPRQFSARVRAVAAGADPTTGSFPVVVSWRNSEGARIKSGMSAQVSIQTRQEVPVLLVPSAALVDRDGETRVFTAQEGTAMVRPVRVGRRLGNLAEIVEGLQEGQTLIITGLAALRQGTPVAATVVGESGTWR